MGEMIVPISKRLPQSAYGLVVMPELFENPYAFLDYMLARFSYTFGDEELSIHLMRSMAESSGINFRNMPKEETMKMINKLTEIINNYKGEEEATNLRRDFMKAYQRCNW
jgi:hypothetical protein